MNPNSPQPSFELPALPDQEVSRPALDGIEKPPAHPEKQIQPAPPMPMVDPQSAAQQVTQSASPAINAPLSGATAAQAAPSLADDSDLIEKEWVLKAKQIIAATRDDPYTQNRELSKFKADYLKKRYNKDIKIEES